MNEMKAETATDQAAATVREMAARATRISTPCGDGEMVWRRWGNGERAVVLFHGAHGSWTHWFRNIPALMDRYTVVAPDLPGMGESAQPPMPASGSSIAAILAEGLDRVLPADAPPTHMVGFSFGASLACLLAERRAERTASLSVCGCGGLRSSPPVDGELKSWRRATDAAEIREAHRHNLAVMMFGGPAAVDDLSIHLQHENTRLARLDNRPIAKEGVTLQSLPKVRAPVMAIWGERDLGNGERKAKVESFMHEAKPGLPYHVIAGAGHWVQYEAAERVNGLLSDFMAAHEG